MEGLIPFVYRAITQHRSGREAALNSWFTDSPSSMSYIRLPGDSGRFQASDRLHLLGSECTTSATASSNLNSAGQILVSTGAQSPLCRLSRRVAA
ncbi:unnamed protein product [Linum tenue]|uniref:Uncharacterized protein n=2 Tax=Linum TaxID=4005 RepID=A0AAV0KYG6_9ROSI|nr:unnamed protein product [Linum tenue]